MKIVKPHFWYNKSQRNGVFFLLSIIILLQIVYSFVNFSTPDEHDKKPVSNLLQTSIDSLKNIELEVRRPKIYPFNPNYISDYKGSQLGMSVEEIDRLIQFRKQNKFINSVNQFQVVTKVSDSLLKKISPYFKFPDWIKKQTNLSVKNTIVAEKFYISTSDLNMATVKDFESINGINTYLANRIVKYRTKLQGFSYRDQLLEVWKIKQENIEALLKIFTIISKPKILKIDINNASFKEVLAIPYIDYQLCKKIFEFRDEVAELQSIDEIKNIQGFPLDKYDRIVLYLEAK